MISRARAALERSLETAHRLADPLPAIVATNALALVAAVSHEPEPGIWMLESW